MSFLAFSSVFRSGSADSGAILRCPVCRVGNLKVCSSSRRSLVPFCGGQVNDGDKVRKKMCDWCALTVVTVERVAGMLTPPDGEKIETLSKTRFEETGLRDPRH